MQPGILYIVATPIGNPQDISLRAKDVLNNVNRIICEERKIGSTLLRKLDIERKPLLELNEHNEDSLAQEFMTFLINGENLALISDCGTPAFADPGATLVALALDYGVRVVPVPGASSLMALLSVVPVKLKEFHYAGFLPRKEEQRRAKLNQLRKLNTPLILMDTPYRLERTLQDIQKTFGKNCLITIGLNLTAEDEQVLHTTVEDVLKKCEGKKAEFILIIHEKM